MSGDLPDWHLYRAFLAAARAGSLSGAARDLGTTQPTAGRQIAALEAALGTTLFVRSQRGLSPTDAGVRLIPAIQSMAVAAEAARRAVSGPTKGERGVVRITASDVIGVEVLPPLLAPFNAAHPRITLELAVTNRNDDVLRGDADVAVRMVRPTQGALIAKRIGTIPIGLYAHRRYLATHGTPSRIQDLAEHALIGPDRDPVYLRQLDRLGIRRDALAFRSDSDLAQLAAVRAGIGIGVCQPGIAGRDENLVAVLASTLAFPLDLWVAMHRDLRTDPRIRPVFDHVSMTLSEYAESCGA